MPKSDPTSDPTMGAMKNLRCACTSRWVLLFATRTLAIGVVMCMGAAPDGEAPTATPASPPATSRPATGETISTIGPTTAPQDSKNTIAQRRRKLLELWESRTSESLASEEPPLYRARTGSVTAYRSLPDGSPLGATLVSVTHAASGREALTQIAQAANLRIGAAAPGMFHSNRPPSFSLDLDHKPLLEAMYETCSRAGWTIRSIEPAVGIVTTQPASNVPLGKIVLEPGHAGHGLGVWTTTGPFLFEVVAVEHSIQIPAGSDGDEATVELRMWTEPKLRAFNVGGGLTVRTALDEREHSLQPRQTRVDGAGQASGSSATLRLGLPANCGRRIARLSMVDHCFIQRTSSVIELKWGDAINSRVVEGMNVSMTTKLEQPSVCEVTLTVSRGERSDLDWGDLRLAIADLYPQLLDTAGAPMQPFNLHNQSGDEPLTIKYSWNNNDSRGRPRAAGKVVLDLPTDVKWVDVPVELRDLPLP